MKFQSLKFGLAAVLATFWIAGIQHVKADDTVIFNSCKKDLQLTDSGCQCVLTEVNSSLTPNQLEVFVAMIQGDNSAMIAAQSSGKLTADDMTTLANFMAVTPNKCKSQ